MVHSSHPRQTAKRKTNSISMTTVLLLLGSTSAQYSNYGHSDGHRPIALHQLIIVQPGGDEVISLRGYDNDGDKLKATVKSLPATGVVHQLSKVFSDFGYEPKKGVTIMKDQDVTGSKGNRLYYKRPSNENTINQIGSYGIMKYTVSDLSDSNQVKSESHEGMITFIPPSGIIVGSHFTRGHEDWTIVGNKHSNSNGYIVNYEASSRGLLNHYIYGSDDVINTESANTKTSSSKGNDFSLWYFKAPKKFHGNHGIAYGSGSIDFTLSSFYGDFKKMNEGLSSNSGGLHLIEIYCATCNSNKGTTLAYPYHASMKKGGIKFNGSTMKYSILLNEKSGWLEDSKNTLKKWLPPSQCSFIEVLSGITSLKILGDFTQWYESVALDNVEIKNIKNSLPICAQITPDASQCTCSPDAYSNTVRN